MILLPVLMTMETAINGYIALNADSKKTLKQLSGKVMGVTFSGLDLTFYVLFNEAGIFLQKSCRDKANLHITATPLSLLKLMKAEQAQMVLQKFDVKVDGDIILAQQVGLFFKSIKIDWEYYASLVAGDIAAHESIRFIKDSLLRLKELSETFSENMKEYLQEEKKLLPNKNRAEYLFEEIDTFRDEVNLLENKIKNLKDKE